MAPVKSARHPARELKDMKPASSLNDQACPTVSRMLPDSRLISAIMMSSASPTVRYMSVFHGRPAVKRGAIGDFSEASSALSAAVDWFMVDVFNEAHLVPSVSSDQVPKSTERRVRAVIRS